MDVIDLCDDEPAVQRARDNHVISLDNGEEVGYQPSAAERDEDQAARQQQQQARGQNLNLHPAQHGQDSDLYLLDCGCQQQRDALTKKLQELVAPVQWQLQDAQTAGMIAEAVGSLSCSHCSAILSAQDVWKLLGASTTSRLYTGLGSSVKQVVLAQQQQQQQGVLATPAAQSIAVCVELWQELSALQALLLGGDPPAAEPPAADPAAAEDPAKQTRRGRQAKQAAKPKPKQKPKAKKYSYGSGGGSAAWAAGTGYGGQAGLTKAAQASMSAAAARQAAADTAMAGHLQAITDILIDPHPTSPSSSAAAGSSAQAAAAGSSARGARAGPSSSTAGGAAAAAVGRKRGRADGPTWQSGSSSLAWPLVGCVLVSPLAWLLRLMFSNDSMMDVVGRNNLYATAMDLLRHVGTSTDLLPLLQLPADDPRDTTAAGTAAGASSSGSSTVLAALTRLEQQAKLYRRSAEQLMGGGDDGEAGEADEATTAAVCLALDLSSLLQGLEEGSHLWNITLGEAGPLTVKPLSTAADTPQPAAAGAAAQAAAATTAGGSRNRKRGSGQNAPPAAAAGVVPPAAAPAQTAEAAAAATQAQQYCTAMQPYRFIEADLLSAGHYFARDAAIAAKISAGGEVMRRRLKRITEELGVLSTSLPLSWDSSILLAVHTDRLDVLRAALLPHPDTPYGGGAFLFDILLPPEYPDRPPRVQFLTTGGGSWRANPNLYACGKVCLSLLGTWAGPSWEPGVSTLLQVLVSLQSMVLVEDPYFNEPGYERSASTPAGKKAAAEYNAQVRFGTASHALLAQLQRPDPVFGEALRLHYSHQGGRVRALMQAWVGDTPTALGKGALQQVVRQVEQELDKLPPPPPTPQQQQQQQQQEGEGVRRAAAAAGGGGSSRRQRGRVNSGAAQQQQQQKQPVVVCIDDDDVVDLT